MAVETPAPNRVLAGRYRLEVRLGVGGMGAIWRAEHLVLQAPVAVKLIDRDAVPDEDTIARFLREAKAAAALRSPHVVQIIDYGVDGLVPFMVMELLEGENLAQRLKRVRRLSRQETARILTHVGRAMQRAHDAGIVHRDLKPENVFLVRNEDEELAKVLDFGVAKVERSALGAEATRTRTGSILGTPYYMSPEQAQGNKAVDHRTDLWALGVIAFECLTGKRPFYSDGLGDLVLTICVRELPVPSDVAPVPLGFDAWFARACARDPDRRFQSAREMTDALREALGLEARDPTLDGPEIVVASGDFGSSGPPAAGSEAPTLARELDVSSSRRSRPEEDAPTMAAGLAEATGADAGIPAPTEALFGTTQHGFPPEPKNSAGVVLLVALAALVAGLIGGLVVLRRNAGPDTQDSMRLPEPAAPPVAAKESLEKRAKKTDGDEELANAAELASEAPSGLGASPQASGPIPSGLAKPGEHGASVAGAGAMPATSASPSGSSAPDGGYQKPAWAIPDNEIRVRRGPDEPDDKIVLPP